MIGNVITLGSGLKIERGSVVDLSDSSALRADHTADMHAGRVEGVPQKDVAHATFYFAGAFPRLPLGVAVIPEDLREGSLMCDRAVSRGLPAKQTRTEVQSTSTIQNVVFVLRTITNDEYPTPGVVRRFIHAYQELAIVGGRGHTPRAVDAFAIMADTRVGAREIYTPEPARRQDRANLFISRRLLKDIEPGDIDGLLEADRRMEAVNDALHHGIDQVRGTIGELAVSAREWQDALHGKAAEMFGRGQNRA